MFGRRRERDARNCFVISCFVFYLVVLSWGGVLGSLRRCATAMEFSLCVCGGLAGLLNVYVPEYCLFCIVPFLSMGAGGGESAERGEGEMGGVFSSFCSALEIVSSVHADLMDGVIRAHLNTRSSL